MTSDLEDLLYVAEMVATGNGRKLRRKLGVPTNVAAAACGVDRATLVRWEGRRCTPRLDTARRYAQFLRTLEGRS